ncbi:MAG: hypothetical protein KDD94_03600, partial [Calditrichaeota bacterium]|nr:hypothetical protein [Calditrichota bacterium]
MNPFPNFKQIIVTGIVFVSLSFSQGKTFVGDSAWNVASNWSPVGVPSATDTVIFTTTDTIYDISTSPLKLRVMSGANITLGASLTVLDSAQISGTLNVANQSFAASGGSGGHIGGTGTLIATTGSISLFGNWSVSNFTEGTSLVTFNGTGNSTIAASETFWRLAVSKSVSTNTLSSASAVTVTIDSSFTVTSGRVLTNAGATLGIVGGASGTDIFSMSTSNSAYEIAGNNTFPTGFETVSLTSASTVRYTGNSPQSVNSSIVYGNLVFSGSGSKAVASGVFDVNGNFSTSVAFSSLATSNNFGGNVTVTGNPSVSLAFGDTYFDGPI